VTAQVPSADHRQKSYRGLMDDMQELAGIAPPATAHAVPEHRRHVFVVGPRRPGLLPALAEAWRFRYLMGYFGKRQIQKRMARTWLGMLWLPLRPGINLATRILVFGGLVGISAGDTPYPIFFIVATAAWQLFFETAFWSMRSLEMNRKIVAKVYVPRLTVVSSALIPASFDFLVNFSFAALAVLYYLVRAHIFYLEIGVRTLLVPAGLSLVLLLGVGLGLLMSSLSARARDIRFLSHYFFQFLYYLTPVIYPISYIPLKARPFAELNPMTGAVEMVKDGLFRAHELSPDAVFVTLIAVFLIWVPGLWLFDRKEVAALHGRSLGLFRRRRPPVQPEHAAG
jgi:lipopolysaccharide transport system permease protein